MTYIKTCSFKPGCLERPVNTGLFIKHPPLMRSRFSQAQLILRPFIKGSKRTLPLATETPCTRQA